MSEHTDETLPLYFDMHGPGALGDAWDAMTITDDLEYIGAPNPDTTQREADELRLMYDRPPVYRRYHRSEHGADVGHAHVPEPLAELLCHFSVNEAKGILGIGGRFHDAVYPHVDAHPNHPELAYRTEVRRFVGDKLELTSAIEDGVLTHRAKLTEAGKQDDVTRMVADVFGLDYEQSIHSKQGGSEFVSALACAKFLEEKQAEPEFLVAAVAGIEATIPFRPSLHVDEQGNISDGCMGELDKRIRSLDFTLGGQQFPAEPNVVRDICLLAVHLANRDITDFVLPNNYHVVVRGGRAIMAEEKPELREDATTIDDQVHAAKVESSSPALYIGLASRSSTLQPSSVPKAYLLRDKHGQPYNTTSQSDPGQTYPPLDVFVAAAEHTEINTWLAGTFFQVRELGIVASACFAQLIGAHNAAVPGIVDAQEWPAPDPAAGISKELGSHELRLHHELVSGPDDYPEQRPSYYSPISGYILARSGFSGALLLSETVRQIYADNPQERNPFAQDDTARRFLKELIAIAGIETFESIAEGFEYVAYVYRDDPHRGDPNREQTIRALRQSLRTEYEAEQRSA